jgi:hypothetical protein
MKYLCSLVLLVGLSLNATAQIWFEIGAKGSYGITALYNSTVWNDSQISNKFTTGFGVGGRLGINFGPTHGIAAEVIAANGKQNWGYQLAGGPQIEFTTAWKTLDYYLLYRNSGNGGYFELGPKISTVSSVKQSSSAMVEADKTGDFNKSMLGAAMGFGGNIAGGDVVALTFGLRFEYMFGEFVSPAGALANQPIPPLKLNDDKTNIVNIQAVLELNFGLGSYARAGCGDRRFVFSWNQ